MSALFYVTTSERGIERAPDGEVQWEVPTDPTTPATTEGPRLVLHSLKSLLDFLDDAVFVAEPLSTGEAQENGDLVVTSAKLLQRTPWDPPRAAFFALDCADHVLGQLGDVELPVGFTLATAIADARRYLTEASDELGVRLGRLARFSAARRLRRTGAKIGEISLAMLEQDIEQELDANSDTAWATTTAAGDAVLAAVEALRHVAAPGYIGAREQTAERDQAPVPLITPTQLATPWGPIMLGVEHESPYLPAGALAREAAFRAREAVGAEGEESERDYQSTLLAAAIEAN